MAKRMRRAMCRMKGTGIGMARVQPTMLLAETLTLVRLLEASSQRVWLLD